MKLIYRSYLFLVFLLSGFSAFAQKPGERDLSFKSIDITEIYATALQPDGKIIIAGGFSECEDKPCHYIARLLENGNLDPDFSTSSGANQMIRAIALQKDGKIIIGGEFYQVAGIERSSLARLNSDGILDTAFTPSTPGNYFGVITIAVQPNGRIVVGGYDAGLYAFGLNTDGTEDSEFSGHLTLNGVVMCSAVQPDGKLLLGGSFRSFQFLSRVKRESYRKSHKAQKKKTGLKSKPATTYTLDFLSRHSIARVNADGIVDTKFNPGSGAQELLRKYKPQEEEVTNVFSITLQPDEKIIISGEFTHYDSIPRNHIARLNPNGSLDKTFNPGSAADSTVLKTILQPDGKIVIAGRFSSYNGTPRHGLARLNADGSLDKTFNPDLGPKSVVNHLVQTEGKLIIVGFLVENDGTYSSIMRLFLN